MSKSKRKTWKLRQAVAVIIGILGFLALLGELGISGVGKGVYNLMKYPLGERAWLAPLLFFVLAFVLWVSAYLGKKTAPNSKRVKSARRNNSTQSRTKNSKTNITDEPFSFTGDIELPKGKLVPLKGFKEYFSTDLELEPMEPLVELEELGKNFDSYFREGKEFSFKPIETRLTSVRGFAGYFDEVSAEIEEEISQKEPLNKIDFVEHYPGQVAQLIFKDKRSRGVTADERAALLGKSSDDFKFKKNLVLDTEISQNIIEEKIEADLDTTSLNKIHSRVAKDQTVSDYIQTSEVTEVVYKKDIETADSLGIISTENKPLEKKEEEVQYKASQELSHEVHLGIPPQIPRVIPQEVPLETPQEPLKAVPQDVSPEIPEKEKRPMTWKLPSFDLLDPLPEVTVFHDQDTQKHLEKVLEDFGVQAKVIRVARGPVITRYELAPAPGVKISRIVNLADDIALGLAARDVRIEAPIPGKSAIGIEVPNKHPRAVPFREVLETREFKEGSAKLRMALGKDIGNQSIVANLAKMPHLLVAGATGSGKSVCITAIINSLLFNTYPDEVKFLMIDPKMVELSLYNGIPHLLAPVVIDPKKASAALKWVVKEMETRYELFAAAGVRDIERYNQMKASESGQSKVPQGEGDHLPPAMPWIVVIIDELADLMMVAANEVEESICRLAQMARAAGIHLVIATQRPSVDVITGVIKANIPSRISFAVSSQIDSRTILDCTGAEKLLGRGDMLYSPQGINKPMRVQGCMVTDDEVQRVISHWKAQGSPEYLDPEGFTNVGAAEKGEGSGPDDELFLEAGRLIITTGMASVSYLQRKLKLGYARAARLIDLLEDEGVVGGYEGSKPRQILLTKEEFEERFG